MTAVRRATSNSHPSRRATRRRGRPQRDLAALEARRMRAVDLFEQQVIPAEIARQVGVSHQIVSDWRTAWRQGGRDALRSAGPAGRKPKLTDAQLDQLVAALSQGTKANGYPTDLWTLARAAEVIERADEWGALPPRARVVSAARPVELVSPAAGAAGHRAERSRRRGVGRAALAADKKGQSGSTR
jgi:transposase